MYKMSKQEKPTGLALLRAPFEKHQILKLPKPTKKQTDDLKADFKIGIRCKECGGWHHKDVVHLDYVGHAALTDRLLDSDPNWNWEPASVNTDGSPKFDQNGGLWIRLNVCGVTRMGYGHADGKSGGDAVKETIGDALRNAAMRFGAALDLWHKGDLHLNEDQDSLAEAKKSPDVAARVLTDKIDFESYVIGFGKKMAGKKLTEFHVDDHIGMLTWLDDQVKKSGKPLSDKAKDYYDVANAYVNSLIGEPPPKVDQSEQFPD